MKLSTAIHDKYIFAMMALYPLITAQVPYEYFEIQSIEPPYIQASLPPAPPEMPDKLTIDSNTDAAGDLQMSEPFAPPVKTYKRRMVFSQIRIVNQSHFLIEPSTEPCQLYQIHKSPNTHTLYRSALIYMNIDPNTILDIPTDSPEMVITSIRAHRLDDTHAIDQNIELYRCPDDRYAIKTPLAGSYQIEYETAALPGSATPVPAEFFIDAVKTKDISPELLSLVHELIASAPALKSILSSHTLLTDLILYFQSFESQSLDLDNINTLMSIDIAKTILIQKKGLCRHRAILFMIIANALGYPVRIAANEVHAFIEIYHHNRWYPVEMGGQARSLTIQSTSNKTTVLQDYSFLDDIEQSTQEPSPTSNQFSNSNHITSSSDNHFDQSFGYINQRSSHIQANDSIDGLSSAPKNSKPAFRFVPLLHIPAHAARHEALNINGQMVDEFSVPIANEIFFLTLKSEDKHLTIYAQTDNKGYISATIQIPPLWPLGETTLEWERKRRDN